MPKPSDCSFWRNHFWTCRSLRVSSNTECLGLHLGVPQSANLGDGRGDVNETVSIVHCRHLQDHNDTNVNVSAESPARILWHPRRRNLPRESDRWESLPVPFLFSINESIANFQRQNFPAIRIGRPVPGVSSDSVQLCTVPNIIYDPGSPVFPKKRTPMKIITSSQMDITLDGTCSSRMRWENTPDSTGPNLNSTHTIQRSPI
jgi:hypothetical protein